MKIWQWMLIAMILGTLSAQGAEDASLKPVEMKLIDTTIRVDARLKDGSELLGTVETGKQNIDINTDALGKLSLSLDRIRSIEFQTSETNALFTLANGDKIRGTILQKSLHIDAVIGSLSIPMSVMKRVEISLSSNSSHQLLPMDPNDWVFIPFPADSDWPGPRGSPANFSDGQVLIRGQEIRTKKAFAFPLTFECELQLDGRTAPDGSFNFFFLPEDAPLVQGQEGTFFGISYSESSDRLAVRNAVPEDRMPQNGKASNFHLNAGQSLLVRIRLLADHYEFKVGDKEFTGHYETTPIGNIRIQVAGWQPRNTWRILRYSVY